MSSNWVVLLLDLGISVVASAFAAFFVRWQSSAVFGFDHMFLMWLVAALVCSFVAFLILGTHKIVIRHSSYRSIGRLGLAVLIKECLMVAALFFGIISFGDFDIMVVEADLTSTLLLLILVRVIIIYIYEKMNDNIAVNVDRLSVMVYGISDKAVSMVTRLEQSPHYNVIGFLTRNKSNAGQVVQSHKVYWFDCEEDIARMKVNLGVESILFAREVDADAEQEGLVKICLHNGIHLLMTPRIEEVDFGGMSSASAKKIVDNDFIPDGMSSFERNFKRAVDFFLATILLIVFSPLFLICALALKLGDKGPVIYKQERIGRFGRPFYIYKFRSMRVDAEADGPQLLQDGENDPRLTKVGGFLRAHHLDELPQLWNVWKGDMAFIGYRPERKYFIDQIMELDPRYYYLYQIRPGVTSYATLKNGYTDSMEKMLRRLEFDLYYLRHRSAWFDIKILFQTFMNIAFGKKF